MRVQENLRHGVKSSLPIWAAFTAAGAILAAGFLMPHDALPLLLALGVPAALAARLSDAPAGVAQARLAMAFVLVGLLVLPLPGGALVGLLAIAASRGAGVCGVPAGGPRAVAVASAAMLLVQFSPLAGPLQAEPGWAAWARLVSLFLMLQGVGVSLAAATRGRAGLGSREQHRLWLADVVNLPLGFLLLTFCWQGAWGALGVLSALVLLFASVLRGSDRIRHDLARAHEALSVRLTELATLHSLGREILSSMDLGRVFATLDRECRKVLPVDFLFVAVVDRRTRQLHFVYRGAAGEPPCEVTRSLGEGLASWVVSQSRAVRIDDFRKDPLALPFRPEVVNERIRSAIAVPLIVEGRVTGVLSVQSREPVAFDDHQLELLGTIGQQAAVAIENARHYEMATIDSLTGLFLREYFFRRLAGEYGRARRYDGRFVVLMADLDGFKRINDTHGHLAGDRYLRQVGSAIRAQLRAADLACRYGGDEFCVLLPETDLEGGRIIAERIREAVSALAVRAEGASLRAGLSVGLAAFPDHEGGDLRALLRRADQALYEAKRRGRDRVRIYQPAAAAGCAPTVSRAPASRVARPFRLASPSP